MVPCVNCGTKVYRTPYRLNKNKDQFCSNKCQKEYYAKLTYEDRPCEVCGKYFHVLKSVKQRFCSHQCQNEWQKTRIGIKNPRFTSQLVKCEWCNREYYIPLYKIENGQHNFCDKKCRREWFAKVWSQQKEWKQKSSERALRILSDGLIPNTNSKPQIIVNKMLEELKIKYVNEYIIKYYALDVYLQNHDLIIEVMGDYWHTNPYKFNTIKYPSQRRTIGRDKSKHTYFVKNHNIEILYLWESDIYNNLELCKALILKYINQNGKLYEYHSFNYSMNDHQLFLNNNRVIPYMEYSNNDIQLFIDYKKGAVNS